MKDLIDALTILLRYGNPEQPTHCSHDLLTICGIDSDKVSREDKAELDRLGFFVNESDNGFRSYRFGSA